MCIRDSAMTEKLMKAIYSDPAQTITLTAWADTVAVDPRDNLLIAVRLSGYPEVTAGLVNAVSGGGTLSVQLDGETLVCTPQQGRYSKAVSRDCLLYTSGDCTVLMRMLPRPDVGLLRRFI